MKDTNPRIGHGYDVHRLTLGRKLILGGIEIESDRGCVAHSDGDVVCHAVADALLGAIGKPDIGQRFPDTDPKWKDAASSEFVKDAFNEVFDFGFVIGNIDVTVLAQEPKISRHKKKMCGSLSRMLTCDAIRVNIKGKTGEELDAIGRGEAIACHAVVLLVRADW